MTWKIHGLIVGLLFCIVSIDTVSAQNSEQSLAQTISLQYSELNNIGSRVQLSAALKQLEKKYNISFIYKSDMLGYKSVPAENLESDNLTHTLQSLLEPFNLTYTRLNNRTFAISIDFTKYAANTVKKVQEQVQIQGTVTDEVTGGTLPGVNVTIKGTTRGASTNVDGEYQITVESLQDTLQFSFIGYQTQEVPINGQTTIDVIMTRQAITGEELVVVGYGTQRKVNLTGAVDQISSETFENMSVSNVSRALQGQIPGLNIEFNSGRPTSSPTYNIRGLTSIGAGGSALILIDGVEGDPQDLNPQDIESVSVLKDAASAAIYGSRGAFGVVLIETKKPTNETQFQYTSTFSANYRTTERDLVTDSYTFAKMYMESYTELVGGTSTPGSVGSVGISFSQEYLNELKYRAENPDHGRPEVVVDPSTGNYLYFGNTDWNDLIFKDNIPSMEHALSASGGTDQASYYISGRYFEQDGLYNIRSDKFTNYNLGSRGSIKPWEWLNIDGNLNYSSNSYFDPFSGDGIFERLMVREHGAPMGVPYNPDGTYTQIGAGSIGLLEGRSGSNIQQDQIMASVGFNASVIENALSISGDFTYKSRINEVDRKDIPVTYSNAPGQTTTPGSTRLFNNKNTLKYYVNNIYANFTQDYGDHALDVVSGANYEVSNSRYLYIDRNNLIIPELDAFNLATGEDFSIEGGGSEWKNFGIFSRVSYRFKEKYLLEMNSRYDGSSKFPRDEQFSFFPSISMGWRISEENFLNRTDNWLNNLKIRASYGSLGNSQISPYIFVPQIRAGQTSKVLQGSRPIVTRTPNVLPDNFTWETSTTFNVGVDIDMFENRFGIVFDYFWRETTDMITVGPVLPAVFGASPPDGNYADLKTEGFEFSLRWRDQIEASNHPISYGIQLTLADDVSYITKFNNPQGNLNLHTDIRTTAFYEGLRYGDIWGLTTIGLFADQADIDNHVDQSFIETNVGGAPTQPGDIKFKDLNGDGKIDWGDRTVDNPGDLSVIGNTQPRYKFGVRLNADYRNFSILTFFQGVGKRDWYPTHHRNPFWGPYGYWASQIPTHFLGNSYTSDNPDPEAYWPRWKGNMAWGNRQLQPQTRYLQNTAYVRLKELTISYTTNRLAENLGVRSLRFFFTGHNIWTYSPVFKISRDIDPEQMDNNWGAYYPMLKSYSLGFSLNI